MRLRSLAVTTVALLSIGGGAATLAAPAVAGTTSPTVTATPNTDLKNQQVVSLSISGFTASETSHSALAVECSAGALQHVNDLATAISYCDTDHPVTVPVDSTGSGTSNFTILGGAGYKDKQGDKCDGANSCYIAVSSDALGTQFGYTPISFDPSVVTPVKTTTVLSGSKRGTAGKKVKITAKTTPKSNNGALSGKVVFTDNGKKVASVSETSTGKVSAKIKLVSGKNRIVATYKGNARYLKSRGSILVKAH